ncbi:hypothetical protein UW638_09685, partial [Streptococcus agalactiae]
FFFQRRRRNTRSANVSGAGRCVKEKGFDPTIKLLQSRALPLGYTAITDNILSKKKRFVKPLS